MTTKSHPAFLHTKSIPYRVVANNGSGSGPGHLRVVSFGSTSELSSDQDEETENDVTDIPEDDADPEESEELDTDRSIEDSTEISESAEHVSRQLSYGSGRDQNNLLQVPYASRSHSYESVVMEAETTEQESLESLEEEEEVEEETQCSSLSEDNDEDFSQLRVVFSKERSVNGMRVTFTSVSPSASNVYLRNECSDSGESVSDEVDNNGSRTDSECSYDNTGDDEELSGTEVTEEDEYSDGDSEESDGEFVEESVKLDDEQVQDLFNNAIENLEKEKEKKKASASAKTTTDKTLKPEEPSFTFSNDSIRSTVGYLSTESLQSSQTHLQTAAASNVSLQSVSASDAAGISKQSVPESSDSHSSSNDSVKTVLSKTPTANPSNTLSLNQSTTGRTKSSQTTGSETPRSYSTINVTTSSTRTSKTPTTLTSNTQGSSKTTKTSSEISLTSAATATGSITLPTLATNTDSTTSLQSTSLITDSAASLRSEVSEAVPSKLATTKAAGKSNTVKFSENVAVASASTNSIKGISQSASISDSTTSLVSTSNTLHSITSLQTEAASTGSLQDAAQTPSNSTSSLRGTDKQAGRITSSTSRQPGTSSPDGSVMFSKVKDRKEATEEVKEIQLEEPKLITPKNQTSAAVTSTTPIKPNTQLTSFNQKSTPSKLPAMKTAISVSTTKKVKDPSPSAIAAKLGSSLKKPELAESPTSELAQKTKEIEAESDAHKAKIMSTINAFSTKASKQPPLDKDKINLAIKKLQTCYSQGIDVDAVVNKAFTRFKEVGTGQKTMSIMSVVNQTKRQNMLSPQTPTIKETAPDGTDVPEIDDLANLKDDNVPTPVVSRRPSLPEYEKSMISLSGDSKPPSSIRRGSSDEEYLSVFAYSETSEDEDEIQFQQELKEITAEDLKALEMAKDLLIEDWKNSQKPTYNVDIDDRFPQILEDMSTELNMTPVTPILPKKLKDVIHISDTADEDEDGEDATQFSDSGSVHRPRYNKKLVDIGQKPSEESKTDSEKRRVREILSRAEEEFFKEQKRLIAQSHMDERRRSSAKSRESLDEQDLENQRYLKELEAKAAQQAAASKPKSPSKDEVGPRSPSGDQLKQPAASDLAQSSAGRSKTPLQRQHSVQSEQPPSKLVVAEVPKVTTTTPSANVTSVPVIVRQSSSLRSQKSSSFSPSLSFDFDPADKLASPPSVSRRQSTHSVDDSGRLMPPSHPYETAEIEYEEYEEAEEEPEESEDELQVKPKRQWKNSAEIASSLSYYLQEVRMETVQNSVTEVVSLLTQLLDMSRKSTSPHAFPTILASLSAIRIFCERLHDVRQTKEGKDLNLELSWIIRALCKISGHPDSLIKPEASFTLAKLVSAAGADLIVRPIYFLLVMEQDGYGHQAGSKGSKTKAAALDTLTYALLTFPQDDFQLEEIAQWVCLVIMHPHRRVRQAALECISVIADRMGAPDAAISRLRKFIEQEQIQTFVRSDSDEDAPAANKSAMRTFDGKGVFDVTPITAIQSRVRRGVLPEPSAYGLVDYGVKVPMGEELVLLLTKLQEQEEADFEQSTSDASAKSESSVDVEEKQTSGTESIRMSDIERAFEEEKKGDKKPKPPASLDGTEDLSAGALITPDAAYILAGKGKVNPQNAAGSNKVGKIDPKVVEEHVEPKNLIFYKMVVEDPKLHERKKRRRRHKKHKHCRKLKRVLEVCSGDENIF